MSLRRLFQLIHYLPADDVFWRAVEADEEREKTLRLHQRLVARRNHYRKRGGAA